jgi:hypothetical protein
MTASRDFSSFCMKQFLLVPIDIPRNDFVFDPIFVELFVFVIYIFFKLAYSSREIYWNPYGKVDYSNIKHMQLGSLNNWHSILSIIVRS